MQIIYTTVMFVPGLATWLLLRPDKRSDEQFHASLVSEETSFSLIKNSCRKELILSMLQLQKDNDRSCKLFLIK